MKYHMEYCNSNPGEVSKLQRVQAKVDEVKGVLVKDIDKVCSLTRVVLHAQEDSVAPAGAKCLDYEGSVLQVLERGERIEVLVEKGDELQNQANKFKVQGTKLHRHMWWENAKVKVLFLF